MKGLCHNYGDRTFPRVGNQPPPKQKKLASECPTVKSFNQTRINQDFRNQIRIPVQNGHSQEHGDKAPKTGLCRRRRNVWQPYFQLVTISRQSVH